MFRGLPVMARSRLLIGRHTLRRDNCYVRLAPEMETAKEGSATLYWELVRCYHAEPLLAVNRVPNRK